MQKSYIRFCRFVLVLLLSALPSLASAETLKPYKDELFAYPGILSQKGPYTVVDYDEMRDINGRDQLIGENVVASLIGDDPAVLDDLAVRRPAGAA